MSAGMLYFGSYDLTVTELLVTVVALLLHGLALVAVLLSDRRHPTTTVAWLLAVAFMPFLGIALYFLFGVTRARRIARRSHAVSEQLHTVLERHRVDSSHDRDRKRVDERTAALLRLGARLTSDPGSYSNASKILENGAATYRAIIQAIEAATHHVHIEFYILRPDETGTALRERLVRRAKEGIEVRVLCDGIGSIELPNDFFEPLERVGGRFAFFRPVRRLLARLRRRDRVDFRNHRKILVVDGRVAFTGGINLGREYLGLHPSLGHVRDTHVRVEGPAARSLQAVFAEDWLASTDELLQSEEYFPPFASASEEGGSAVQVIDSSPDRTWSSIQHVYSQCLALARQRAWITSPYFVPTSTIEDGLITASLRGVDVRLLLPSRSDNLLVRTVSRTFYARLLEAGVRIFEYEAGFVHAKTMVVDRWVGTIGSANMDSRSFHLNFEVNAFVYGATFSDTLAHQFEVDLRHADEITEDPIERQNFPRRLLIAAARLLAPLL